MSTALLVWCEQVHAAHASVEQWQYRPLRPVQQMTAAFRAIAAANPGTEIGSCENLRASSHS
jgi:hypothetical protein